MLSPYTKISGPCKFQYRSDLNSLLKEILDFGYFFRYVMINEFPLPHGYILSHFSFILPFGSLYSWNETLFSDKYEISTFDKIIEKIDLGLKLINRLNRNKMIIFLIGKKDLQQKYNHLLESEINMIIMNLTDLRSDLATRLTEQRSILESAKTEVENNIQGTTELEQVSEAQKLRLDRQIEQFEELQRVLVRV